MSQDGEDKSFELVVTLEGVVEPTGNTTMAREDKRGQSARKEGELDSGLVVSLLMLISSMKVF